MRFENIALLEALLTRKDFVYFLSGRCISGDSDEKVFSCYWITKE